MYRIYTEDVNREAIQALADSFFDGYTLIPSVGVWAGTHEASLIVEVATEARDSVHELASEIKALNHQQAVLVTHVRQDERFV
jgi:hypothetical protein